MTWQAIYESDAQGLWALLIVPALFLARMPTTTRKPGADARATRFVRAYAIAFAIETMLDPIVTGPVVRALGAAGTPLADTIALPFVLVGDFRVFVLLLAVATPTKPLLRTVAAAAAWTAVVPAIAWPLVAVLRSRLPHLPDTTLWIVYEGAFAALALAWRSALVPIRVGPGRPHVVAYLRLLCAYVATYYGLWALADVLVVAGVDAGWALRIVPNQLYYSWWLPVAVGAFFAERYAPASTSAQTSR